MVEREIRTQHDRELERRVINFLARQHFPRLQTIKVHARDGVVVISGRVNSFYERQMCIHCCQRVAGVVQLKDQVEVHKKSETTPGRFGGLPQVVIAN